MEDLSGRKLRRGKKDRIVSDSIARVASLALPSLRVGGILYGADLVLRLVRVEFSFTGEDSPEDGNGEEEDGENLEALDDSNEAGTAVTDENLDQFALLDDEDALDDLLDDNVAEVSAEHLVVEMISRDGDFEINIALRAQVAYRKNAKRFLARNRTFEVSENGLGGHRIVHDVTNMTKNAKTFK